MKESNKEREKYNLKTEKILNALEEIYKVMVQNFKESLFNFVSCRIELLNSL